ncbi:MAG: DUF3857 and transglutaminase domain-containing protein [Ignavibacteriales bacterium]|nr:DUF3857 and transglutaminase domain-containing protein [Ignavibacteriales bacterium]
MTKYILILFFIMNIILLSNDQQKYAFSNINFELLKDADAVVRDYTLELNIEDIDEATLIVTKVVTILNHQGQDFSKINLIYDSFRKVENLEAYLYDENGNEIREIESDEIKDYAIISGTSLFSDSRYKFAELFNTTFPYTVKFVYEISYSGFINLPSWIPEEKNASIEYSSYKITLPSTYKLRYLEKKIEEKPVIKQLDEDNTTYLWEVKNLNCLKIEKHGPAFSNQARHLIVSPTKFLIDGYYGDMSSWSNFGIFINDLWKTKQNLPNTAIEKIENLTKGINDKKEVIKILYKYLQSHTRYYNLTIGIGGWQPISANNVFENGYGDCKALTNLMITMLKYANIEAYPALIYNSSIKPEIDISFPNNQFNHVIAFVPLDSDSVWLECTSQTFPFNHIGSNNENRVALKCTSDGGELISTPKSTSLENSQTRKVTLNVKPNATCSANISINYTGNRQDEINYIFNNYSDAISKLWLNNILTTSNYNLISHKYSKNETSEFITNLNVDLDLTDIVSNMGSRLLLKTNLLKNFKLDLEEDSLRIYPIIFNQPQSNIDTILINIPPNYKIEAYPEPFEVNSKYYSYKRSINKTDSSMIVYSTEFAIHSYQIPNNEYYNFKDLMQKLNNYDSQKIIFVELK